jgi:zinc transport system permease protein
MTTNPMSITIIIMTTSTEMASFLTDPVTQRALLAGIAVALVAGPIGCFIVWRRMAYFGETLAHAGLLGVGIGMMLSVNIMFGALITSVMLVAILLLLKSQMQLALDTLLGMLSHTALALGMIAVGLAGIDDGHGHAGESADEHAGENAADAPHGDGHVDVLFGDIMQVTTTDVMTIWLSAIIVIFIIVWLWRELVAISVHEDLASAEGVNVRWVEAAFMLITAATMTMAMKIMGLLLITALTVIPAAAARRVATSPETMALWAALFAAIAVMAGLAIASFSGALAGPTIVLAASTLFVLTLTAPKRS